MYPLYICLFLYHGSLGISSFRCVFIHLFFFIVPFMNFSMSLYFAMCIPICVYSLPMLPLVFSVLHMSIGLYICTHVFIVSLYIYLSLILLHTLSIFHIPISTSLHHYLFIHTYISLPLYICIYHLTPCLSLDWYIPISLYLAHLCRFIPIPSLSFDLHISIPPTHISHYPYIYISPQHSAWIDM